LADLGAVTLTPRFTAFQPSPQLGHAPVPGRSVRAQRVSTQVQRRTPSHSAPRTDTPVNLPHCDRFIVALSPWLGRLPVEIRAGLVAYARDPEPVSVPEVARRLKVSRRTLDRKLMEAGFGGTARFLRAAAMIRVWEILASSHGAVRIAAQRAGYTRMKTFQLHARTIFGVSARKLLKSMGPEEFVERLAQATLRRAD
jgi:AraC-like DNA-binding protein